MTRAPGCRTQVRCAKCGGEGVRAEWSKGMQPATWMLFDLWKCNACMGFGRAALSQYERAPFDGDTSVPAMEIINAFTVGRLAEQLERNAQRNMRGVRG